MKYIDTLKNRLNLNNSKIKQKISTRQFFKKAIKTRVFFKN